MEKRPLHEADVQETQEPHHQQVQALPRWRRTPTVQPSDIPEELRGLNADESWALRPPGAVHRTRRLGQAKGTESTPTRSAFWWRPEPVREQIRLKDHAAARAACAYLMNNEVSSWKHFVNWHMRHTESARIGRVRRPRSRRLSRARGAAPSEEASPLLTYKTRPQTQRADATVRALSFQKFLQKHAGELTGEASDQRLQLPRRCLEEVGVECASWTHVRSSHDRRLRRRLGREAARGLLARQVESSDASDWSDSSSSESSDSEVCPVAEYGADYELFQFVCDLWLWSNLGGKKNKASTPLRDGRLRGLDLCREAIMLAHDVPHRDTVRVVLPVPQVGGTRDASAFRSRLHLPVAETLHIAHTLAQTVVASGRFCFFSASYRKASRNSSDGFFSISRSERLPTFPSAQDSIGSRELPDWARQNVFANSHTKRTSGRKRCRIVDGREPPREEGLVSQHVVGAAHP